MFEGGFEIIMLVFLLKAVLFPFIILELVYGLAQVLDMNVVGYAVIVVGVQFGLFGGGVGNNIYFVVPGTVSMALYFFNKYMSNTISVD